MLAQGLPWQAVAMKLPDSAAPALPLPLRPPWLRWAAQAALMAGLLAASCKPLKDDPQATLAIPKVLPAFADRPKSMQDLDRSNELLARGTQALAAGQLAQEAIPLLTEALAACPGNTQARLELARAFVRGGRPSVALALLEPAKAAVGHCGMCLELLVLVSGDPEFAPLLATDPGKRLLSGVHLLPLPYANWSRQAAASLVKGDARAIEKYVEATWPLLWLRSCPSCPTESARPIQSRALQGMPLIAKMVSRFDPNRPERQPTLLSAAGEPTCAQRCCTWPAEQAPTNQAALKRICWLPLEASKPMLTEVWVLHGPLDR